MLEECAQAHSCHLPCDKQDGRPVLLGCLFRRAVGCGLGLGHIILQAGRPSQQPSLRGGGRKEGGGGGGGEGGCVCCGSGLSVLVSGGA